MNITENVTTVTADHPPHNDDMGALDGFFLGVITTLFAVVLLLHARAKYHTNKVNSRTEPMEDVNIDVEIDNEAVV